jgi:RuvB-like protein 1 (pontin 52)
MLDFPWPRDILSLTNRCSILAKAGGRAQIDVQDVAECEELFLDARRSAAMLAGEGGKGYIS